MRFVTLIADFFSNKPFHELRQAYDLLKEDNLRLLENGVQQARDLGADIETITAELDAAKVLIQSAENTLKESQEESELLLLQLHQSQEELESLFLKEQDIQAHLENQNSLLKERETQLAALSKEKAAIELARDEQIKLVQATELKIQTLNQQLDEKNKDATGLKEQLKQAHEENELLLLQLHQVQEELEHHFLEAQGLQSENSAYAKRLKRLEIRQPNYLDFESIVPTSVDAVSENPRIDWSVKEVLVDGVMHADYKFATFIEDGLSGIEITLENNKLLRLVPRSLLKPQALKEIAEFRNFSTLNWRQIQVAISCVESFFQDPAQHASGHKLPANFDLVFWRQLSAPLIADVRALPAVFRFSRAKLKRELVHTDYEHLWLEIYDASFGETHWPKLELRLGAANIQPGGFSRYPKIEIPRIDGKISPFPSWFEESFDDFGGKLEIRFDLNKQLFDLGVWLRVSNQDRQLLLSLIGSLPLVLKALEQDKVAIGRPWDSWMGLVSGLSNVIRKRLDEAGEVLKKEDAKKQADAKKLEDNQVEKPEVETISTELKK